MKHARALSALAAGLALLAFTPPLWAQESDDQDAEQQESEEDQAEEEVEPDTSAEVGLANSQRWSVIPGSAEQQAVENPNADLPPPLPTIEMVETPGFQGRPVNFAMARWQAQIYSTSALSTYQPSDWINSGGRRADWEMSHRCGGTVIAQQWLITAAHCFNLAPAVAAKRRIRLGAPDISNLARRPGNTYRILQVVRHPYYVPKQGYDIALVRFAPDGASGPNPADSIVPIGRRDTGYQFTARDRVVAMGWGKTENVEGDQANAALLKMALNYVPEAACQGTWGKKAIPSGIILCAGTQGVSTCTGDSGGPVIINEANPVLVGVVSWGYAQCNGNTAKPGVYTKISAFNGWIDCVMRTYSNCASSLPPRRTN